MEPVESLLLSTIKECGKDTRLVDLQLGFLAQQVIVPLSCVEFGCDAFVILELTSMSTDALLDTVDPG